jgi:CRP-like cAMP-binding protein
MNRLSDLVYAKFLEILCKPRFKQWVDFTVEKRKAAQENEKNNALANVVSVMKNSKKGKRSLVDVEILAKFMATITCVPKLSASDMKKLCNELDWVACFGKSLIFLQGDFGAVFYMIAQGSVDLYLETSKDKEMSNARQYGDLRGKTISDDQCTDLGKKIVNLKTGWGFGEMAILSTTHQFRGATAVAAEENSLLLVVHADTYK